MSKGSDRKSDKNDKGGAAAAVETATAPMGFGSVPIDPKIEIETPENGRDAVTGKPYCGRHNVLMRASSTQGAVAYYRCPVEGCEEKAKRTRVGANVPAMPMLCQRMTCRADQIALEVDAAASSIGQFKMVCRRCGDASYVPAPGFGSLPGHRRVEQAAEDFAAR